MSDKVLILTGRFGSGHISAAEAVREVLMDSNNVKVEIVDIVDYAFPFMSKSIYKNFNAIVEKSPNIYNAMNKLAEEKSTGFLNFIALKRIKRLINNIKPIAIISVLPLSSQMIAYYKGKYGDQTPLYTIVTDICSHNEWIAYNTDRYFVADETTKEAFIKKGVPEEKLIVSGIPIRNKFKNNSFREVKSKKSLLIMGGGLGLIPNCYDMLELLNKEENIYTTVITGYNEVLEKDLKERFENIRIIGFTNKVDKEIKDADLIISKAGGITLFETIYMERPMMVINPFLAQEKANAKYIEEKELGLVIRDKKVDGEYLVNKVKTLLMNENEMGFIHNNLKAVKEIVIDNSLELENILKVS